MMKKNSLSKHAAEPLLKLCYLTLYELSGEQVHEVSYRELVDKFFIDNNTARRIIAILENFVAEDINEHIALEGSSYEAVQRNPHAEPYYIPQIRLTLRETKALLSSLVSTGLEHNDDILGKLKSVSAKEADINQILSQNFTADHTSHYSISPWKIAICCLSKQRFQFKYRKSNGILKDYLADPLYVMYKDGRWYMNAWDVQDHMQKFFVLSKMKDMKPAGCPAEEHAYTKLNSFTFSGEKEIEVNFNKGAYFDIVSHSALEQIERTGDDIIALHDATHPEWIAKQIASSDGLITSSDERVKKAAKSYAEMLIEKAKGV